MANSLPYKTPSVLNRCTLLLFLIVTSRVAVDAGQLSTSADTSHCHHKIEVLEIVVLTKIENCSVFGEMRIYQLQ